ncbi:MAG: multicopper oxidase family protein [Pseudomonadota bacterium]|nr:multicopper oxidase family protein [Pseudomonadota bacterium]
MNRRKLLTSTLALGSLLPLASKNVFAEMAGMNMPDGKMSGMEMPGGAAKTVKRIRKLPIGAPLTQLAKLENISKVNAGFEAVIEAGTSTHEFVPGLASQVLVYNGTGAGVVIEATEGDRVKIAFKNRIPNQPSTIHWHGLEIPAEQDGGPMNPVASGADYTYEFTIPEGSAGSYWYHPHPHGLTSEQVYRGLAAPFIVHSKNDFLSPELGDTTLFITTVSLNFDGTIAENTDADLMNGREGDHVLVNGAKQPILTLPPGSSRRFRIYNATNGRYLRLALEGHMITLVGTDGGLISAPIRGLKELILAPAERAEIIVDFKSKTGRFNLMSGAYERGWMGDNKPATKALPLMTFELTGVAVKPIALPEKLRDIVALGESTASKRLEFSENMGMGSGAMTMNFLIDGKSFDMNRVDIKARVGEVELWEIYNDSDMDHPFHIHGTQFQIVEREKNREKTPVQFLAWKDTVNITSKETVRIKVRYSTAGLRMYHCHILEHEDNGMMGTLDVV